MHGIQNLGGSTFTFPIFRLLITIELDYVETALQVNVIPSEKEKLQHCGYRHRKKTLITVDEISMGDKVTSYCTSEIFAVDDEERGERDCKRSA